MAGTLECPKLNFFTTKLGGRGKNERQREEGKQSTSIPMHLPSCVVG